MNKLYKVVRRKTPNTFVSCIHSLPGKFVITYTLNHTSEPITNSAGIFAFTDLKDAALFFINNRKQEEDLVILCGEGTFCRNQLPTIYIAFTLDLPNPEPFDFVPRGTVYLDGFIPTSIIKESEIKEILGITS
jgi:hypothetical protein